MSTAQRATEAGSFATSRRGGLTGEEMRQIEAHRNRERPTPWQALSTMYGRPVDEIRALFELPEKVTEAQPEPAQIRTGFDWTERADKLLRVAYGEFGSSLSDVAQMIGCTKAQARERAACLGVQQGGGR